MKFLIALFLILPCSLTFGQTEQENLIDRFFETYEQEGSSLAIDNIFKTNAWMSRNPDALSQLKSSFSKLTEELVGKYMGYEKMVYRSVGTSYSLHSYMVKYDRQPIRVIFQFYRPGDSWRIFSLAYDDSFDDELEISAQLNYINYPDN